MDNNSYRSQHIASRIENEKLNERSVQAYASVWNCISKAEEEIGKTLEEGYTRDEYVSLFSKMKITSVFVLMPYKSHIGQYLKYLVSLSLLDKQYVDEMYSITYEDIEIDKSLESKFFKNFDALQYAIDSALWAAEKVDDGVFAMQISAIYLAWCGVRIEELVKIKKSDVHEDSISVGGREVAPPAQIMEYIKEYKDATEYQSQAKNVITLKYVPSDLLFRTVKTSEVTAKALRVYICKFGKQGTDNESNIFNYEKVYWSGVFSRAYIYESINGSIQVSEKEKIESVFHEKYADSFVANKRLREYHRFKKTFYPDPHTTA